MAKRSADWPGCLLVMLPGSGRGHWHSDGCQTGENICLPRHSTSYEIITINLWLQASPFENVADQSYLSKF